MFSRKRDRANLPGMILRLITAGLLASQLLAQQRPNVLWIIGEDLGPELGCYGTPAVKTPTLDRMAREGLRFELAFSPTPVCSTSRSGFMTGMYPIAIGAHNHRSHRDDGFTLPEGVLLLSDRMRAVGYQPANLRRFPDGLRGTGKTDWNFHYRAPDGGTRAFDVQNFADLREPFCAQVNFPETHRGGAWNSAPAEVDPSQVELPSYYPDHPVVRADWAQYLNSVQALDGKVAQVLAALEESGLLERTVVFFLGDHGRAHVRGKQWCYDSGLRVPLIMRWPGEYPAPSGYVAGSVDRRLVSLLDVHATTLAIAGVSKPEHMHGRVLFGEHADPAREVVFGSRDRCDETSFRIRTARDERYRYIRNDHPERPFLALNRYKERSYPMLAVMRELDAAGQLDVAQSALLAPDRPREELYDLRVDPYEIHNLAADPAHREALLRMRRALGRWIEATRDTGRTPESAQVLDAWERKMAGNARSRRKK